MKWTEDFTNTINILSYITVLPKDEQDIELRRRTQNIKNVNTINKNQRYSGNYRKLLNKIVYLSELNGLS